MKITFSKLGSMGRLGNQLFQIASTIGVAKENDCEFSFPFWGYSKFFKKQIPQEFINISEYVTHRERSFNYNHISISRNTDLLGYYQSEKYFLNCRDLVSSFFEFDPSLISISLDGYCSVHVRRTDYLKLNDYHPVQNMDYYNKSIDIMRSCGVSKFMVFSDDIEWCKENFKGGDFIFSEGFSDIEDLARMSLCSHNIIANSSFSWWGAWLNKNENKKIIAPSNWFGPSKGNTITSDLYCSGWINI